MRVLFISACTKYSYESIGYFCISLQKGKAYEIFIYKVEKYESMFFNQLYLIDLSLIFWPENRSQKF